MGYDLSRHSNRTLKSRNIEEDDIRYIQQLYCLEDIIIALWFIAHIPLMLEFAKIESSHVIGYSLR